MKNSKAINTSICFVAGLDWDGKKEVFSVRLGRSYCSGFWLDVLTHLKVKGIDTVLITARDNLALGVAAQKKDSANP